MYRPSQAARRADPPPDTAPHADEEVPEDAGLAEGRMDLMRSRQVVIKPSIQAAEQQMKETEEEKLRNWVRGFCRLALFCENRHVPIKREDVTKKIFDGDRSAVRIFPAIFRQVQRQLRKVFAVELVPLRPRGQENEALAQQKRELQATQTGMAASQNREEPSPDTAKAWVVRSVLPPHLRKEMMVASRRIAREVGPSSEEAHALGQVRPADPAGLVVDWQRADAQLGSMGLLYLVLGLILLSGRELPDGKLRAYLAHLGLTTSSILPRALRPDDTFPPGKPDTEQSSIAARQTDSSPHTVNDWLEMLTKQQYLEVENKQATITGQRQRRTHRTRKPRAGGDEAPEDEDLVWKWGGRAEVEIGEEAAANFIAEIMEDGVEAAAAEGEEPGPPGRRRQRNRATQAAPQMSLHDSLMTSVERAVGSQFVS